MSGEIAVHLLIVVPEAVTNVGRHAEATAVAVRITVDEDNCRLTAIDNGVGMGSDTICQGALG